MSFKFQLTLKNCATAIALVSSAVFAACGGSSTAPETTSTSSAVPFPPTPDSDSFYAQPSPMPKVAPGTILKSRAVQYAPALSVPLPNPAWQLQYMTRDVNNKPLAAVATVVKPLIPPLIGASPLVSYQFAYNSLGARCAPSHTLTGGTDNKNTMLETAAYTAGLDTQGWTMVFPDFEGPYHAYGAGKLAGQATLDGIRAALSFEPLGLTPHTPVGLWGYSGGGLATSWAATLHPRYAPELNIVGAASGGTPADVFSVVQASEGTPFFPLIFTAIVGTNRAYPQLLPDNLLNDAGRSAIEAVRDACVGDSGPSGRLSDFTTAADPFNTPGAVDLRPKVTLPQKEVPAIEMYVYHEILDELVPIAGTDAMVAAWCAAGVSVSYQRSLSGEHIAGVASGAPLALAYLIGRFNGSPVPVVPPTAQRCN